jgi:hypothetical protein
VSAHLRIEWERRIATRPEGERLVMFKNVCIDAAEYVGRNGAAKSEIIKVLTDIAVGHAFFGIDGGEIGRIIDDSLDAAEVERISWEELSKAADEKQRGLSPPLTLADWLSRKLPTPDYLLGHLLSTTSRVQINAPTGIGKTMLGIAIAMRLPAGSGFLHWDGVRRARTPRTLLIDGEMSRRLLQQRLIDEAARLGGPIPEGMHILSREDFENFAPLNKPEGQKLIEQQIERIGGVDLITFDNVMSLIEGDMKDEESWRQMLPWVLSLTRRRHRAALAAPHRARRNARLRHQDPRVADGHRDPSRPNRTPRHRRFFPAQLPQGTRTHARHTRGVRRRPYRPGQ